MTALVRPDLQDLATLSDWPPRRTMVPRPESDASLGLYRQWSLKGYGLQHQGCTTGKLGTSRSCRRKRTSISKIGGPRCGAPARIFRADRDGSQEGPQRSGACVNQHRSGAAPTKASSFTIPYRTVWYIVACPSGVNGTLGQNVSTIRGGLTLIVPGAASNLRFPRETGWPGASMTRHHVAPGTSWHLTGIQ